MIWTGSNASNRHSRLGRYRASLLQHPPHPERRAPVSGLGVERFDQHTQLNPENHLIALCRKLFPACGYAATFEVTGSKSLLSYQFLSVANRVYIIADVET